MVVHFNLEQRGRGNPTILLTTKTKLILKGVPNRAGPRLSRLLTRNSEFKAQYSGATLARAEGSRYTRSHDRVHELRVGRGPVVVSMKVILFGATGMVGQGVLRQCLLDSGVESVLSIGRSPSGVSHPKLHDLVRGDMFDCNVTAAELDGYDTCFFCLGVSSVGMSEPEYTHLTYDLTMGWARALARIHPTMRFLYVSGMGTGGKSMWAQVKGRTENDLLALFPGAIMIRLAALRPMHGERSKAPGGGALLTILSPLWPVFQWLWPKGVITTEELGRAMILAAREGAPKRVLESADLVALGR